MRNEFSIPHEIFEDYKFKKLPESAKILYIILCKLKNRYADADGYFWRSIETLMDDTDMSKRTVIRSKNILVKSDFIECLRGKYKATKFRAPNWYSVNGFKDHS